MKRWNASDPAASEAVRKIPSLIVGKNFAGGSGVAEFRSHESLRRIGEQRVEGRSKRHCMYDEKLVVGEDEGDEFKESDIWFFLTRL